MEPTLELNTKIYNKDNLDLFYLITDKKLLNGILHYKLKSYSSGEMYLSEFAIKARFTTDNESSKMFSKKTVSRLFSKIIKNGYIIGKANDK